jgi:hypothetical protein
MVAWRLTDLEEASNKQFPVSEDTCNTLKCTSHEVVVNFVEFEVVKFRTVAHEAMKICRS